MKYLFYITGLLFCTLSVQAKPMSECHYACFEQKYQCNIDKSYTLNTCDKEFAECRLKCESEDGKNLYVSIETSPFEINF